MGKKSENCLKFLTDRKWSSIFFSVKLKKVWKYKNNRAHAQMESNSFQMYLNNSIDF